MKRPLLVLSAILLTTASAGDPPLLYQSDFSGSDLSKWAFVNPEGWRVTRLDDGNEVLETTGKTSYQPPHRSPRNIALLKDVVVGDFVLTARVQTKQTSRGHRDMCLFFGHQDPANFYYMHLGQKRDDHANQIFIVNDAPRVKISEKASEGTPWKDATWHRVKVVRRVSDGLIEVYFDDMENPTHVAHDRTFTWGRVGLGTFDDLGYWDDVEVRGVAVKAP